MADPTVALPPRGWAWYWWERRPGETELVLVGRAGVLGPPGDDPDAVVASPDHWPWDAEYPVPVGRLPGRLLGPYGGSS